MSISNFESDVRIKGSLTVDGDQNIEGDVVQNGSYSAETLTATTGDITADAGDIVATAGDVTVTAGNIVVTAGDISADAGDVSAATVSVGATQLSDNAGTLTADSPFTSESPLKIGNISLTNDTTVLTCNVGLQATGPIYATQAASVSYLVETISAASSSQAAYVLGAGVRTVTLATTGAGGPFAITLGGTGTNGLNHLVTFVMTAYNTSAYTLACLQGTITFDAVGESATLRQYSNGNWTIVALHGATVA